MILDWGDFSVCLELHWPFKKNKIKKKIKLFFFIDWEATIFFKPPPPPPAISYELHCAKKTDCVFPTPACCKHQYEPAALEWFCLGLREAKSTQIPERYGNSLLSEGCLHESKTLPFPLQGSLTRMSFLEALVLLSHYCTTEPCSCYYQCTTPDWL